MNTPFRGKVNETRLPLLLIGFDCRLYWGRQVNSDDQVQSTPMHRHIIPIALATSAFALFSSLACAEPLSLEAASYPVDAPAAVGNSAAPAPRNPVRLAAGPGQMGGGFIEFLFGGGSSGSAEGPRYEPYEPAYQAAPAPAGGGDAEMDPKYLKQVVDYTGGEPPGTIIVDTPHKFLFLVEPNGKALRYGIGVGRPGFAWAGVKRISAKREWPDWRPPEEMLERRPDLPGFMAGGPENPLGARALYLGSTLYRIHGSNEPWTIGTQVSSGCIRMRNEDVIDLYGRVKVGTKVVVI
jgi:lipoprotein-anchoring transpeptidase ErfK/SrfK